MDLQNYTLEQKLKAMIDAGHHSYASLARKINCTPSVVRRVVIADSPIHMSKVEALIINEIGKYLKENQK